MNHKIIKPEILISNNIVKKETFYDILIQLLDLIEDQETKLADITQAVDDLILIYKIMLRSFKHAGLPTINILDSFHFDIDFLIRNGFVKENTIIDLNQIDEDSLHSIEIYKKLIKLGNKLSNNYSDSSDAEDESFNKSNDKYTLKIFEQKIKLASKILNNFFDLGIGKSEVKKKLSDLNKGAHPEEIILLFLMNLTPEDFSKRSQDIIKAFSLANVNLHVATPHEFEHSIMFNEEPWTQTLQEQNPVSTYKFLGENIDEENIHGLLVTDKKFPYEFVEKTSRSMYSNNLIDKNKILEFLKTN